MNTLSFGSSRSMRSSSARVSSTGESSRAAIARAASAAESQCRSLIARLRFRRYRPRHAGEGRGGGTPTRIGGHGSAAGSVGALMRAADPVRLRRGGCDIVGELRQRLVQPGAARQQFHRFLVHAPAASRLDAFAWDILPPNAAPALDLIAAAAYNGAVTIWASADRQCNPGRRQGSIDRTAAALLRQARGWAAALGCIALVLAGAMPDPAWGQYRQRRLQPAERRVRVVFEPPAVDRRQRRLSPAVCLGAGIRRQLSGRPRDVARPVIGSAARLPRVAAPAADLCAAARTRPMRRRPLPPAAAGRPEAAGVRRCRGGRPRGAVAGIRSARGARSALEW